jgi:hypothetical protein
MTGSTNNAVLRRPPGGDGRRHCVVTANCVALNAIRRSPEPHPGDDERRLIVGSIRKRSDRSKPYQARYRAPDGRERTRAFKRKIDAERWLLERERDKARGDWVDPALEQMVFSQWPKESRRPVSTADRLRVLAIRACSTVSSSRIR